MTRNEVEQVLCNPKIYSKETVLAAMRALVLSNQKGTEHVAENKQG